MTEFVDDVKSYFNKIENEIFPGYPNNNLTLTYETKNLKIMKPMISLLYYELHHRSEDWYFSSKKQTFHEKAYFRKHLKDEHKEFNFYRTNFAFDKDSGFFHIGKNLYSYLISNTQFKNSFAKKVKMPEQTMKFLKDKDVAIHFRTKNVPNQHFFSYNKIGISITDKVNKNQFLFGIEVNKLNEAKRFFDNSISYWNHINLHKKQKIDLQPYDKLDISPFFYYFFKRNFIEEINNKKTNLELVYGLGLHVNKTEKTDFKINLLSNIKAFEKLDFSAKLKFKRMNLHKMSESIENVLEKEFSFSHLKTLYFEGKDVYSIKAIFNNAVNENFYLNGILKCSSNQNPYYGIGMKFVKNNLKNDVRYGIFLDNEYELKADVCLGFENHKIIYGLNIVKNIPFPYVNYIYNVVE